MCLPCVPTGIAPAGKTPPTHQARLHPGTSNSARTSTIGFTRSRQTSMSGALAPMLASFQPSRRSSSARARPPGGHRACVCGLHGVDRAVLAPGGKSEIKPV